MHDPATVPTTALKGGHGDQDATLAVLDQEVLDNLRDLPGDDGGNLLDELITLFAQEAPPRIAQLRSALLEGEAKRVMQVAHSLKGSSANLGATCMAGLCNDLERRGHDGNLDGGLQVHDQLTREYERVQMALALERTHPA
jgi:HPt (histidine-containing phosphotransfer) domain-containing protein